MEFPKVSPRDDADEDEDEDETNEDEDDTNEDENGDVAANKVSKHKKSTKASFLSNSCEHVLIIAQ